MMPNLIIRNHNRILHRAVLVRHVIYLYVLIIAIDRLTIFASGSILTAVKISLKLAQKASFKCVFVRVYPADVQVDLTIIPDAKNSRR